MRTSKSWAHMGTGGIYIGYSHQEVLLPGLKRDRVRATSFIITKHHFTNLILILSWLLLCDDCD